MSGSLDTLRSPADAWLREATDRFVHEVRLFGRTFAAFVLRPGRSARAWQSGERTFMNPLGFGASAAGVYWGVNSVLTVLWPVPGSDAADTLGEQIASAVGPYLHYGLLGLAMPSGFSLSVLRAACSGPWAWRFSSVAASARLRRSC